VCRQVVLLCGKNAIHEALVVKSLVFADRPDFPNLPAKGSVSHVALTIGLHDMSTASQNFYVHNFRSLCLQCFDTVGWASGRASGLYKLSDEVLVWLSVWGEVQIVCMVQLMPLSAKNPIISCLI